MTIERKKVAKGYRYRAEIVHRGRKYRGSWRGVKRKALRDEAELLDARAAGTLEDEYGPNRIPSLEEAVEEYLEHCKKRVERGDLAPRSYDSKEQHFRLHIVPRFGDQRLDQITRDQVVIFKRFLYRHEEIGSGSTVNRYMGTFSALFGYYSERVPVNPVSGVPRYEENKDAWQAPTREDVERLVARARRSGNRHLAPIVRLCFELAARINEIRPLRWDQIDFNWCDRSGRRRGLITWESTKAGERQTAPLSVPARAELLRQRKSTRGSDWCFPSPAKPDQPISYASVNDAWNIVVRDLGCPSLRLHDLRHGRATQLIGLNVESYRVQRLGRWKSRAAMDRYIHMDPDHAVGALEVAEALPDEASVTEIRDRLEEEG